jgi:hypothetical protein
MYFLDAYKRKDATHVPVTDSSSLSWRPKNSIGNREASGEEGLWVGGVGNEADGADGDTRASKGRECGPSTIRWARM